MLATKPKTLAGVTLKQIIVMRILGRAPLTTPCLEDRLKTSMGTVAYNSLVGNCKRLERRGWLISRLIRIDGGMIREWSITSKGRSAIRTIDDLLNSR